MYVLCSLFHPLHHPLVCAVMKVVLKTLVVIHRLMNEGSEGFLRLVSEKPLELNTLSFHDRRNSLAWAMTRLIHAFGDYLVEKATVFKNIQFCGERVPAKESSKFFMELSLSSKLDRLIPFAVYSLACCFDNNRIIGCDASRSNATRQTVS